MPTPTNRVPVRVARGNLATLTASIDKLYEGEIVYALDQQAIYAVEAGSLIPVAGTSVTSVNGQTGTVRIGVGELTDTNVTTVVNGDMLVYVDGQWINTPATSGGTVLSIDVTGSNGITATGGPVTSSGVIEVALEPTGVTAGQYTFPVLTVDANGRITQIESAVAPDIYLDDLANVDVPAPGIGDGLVWNGINWVASPDVGGGGASSLNELTDVDTTTVLPQNGQALVWDNIAALWKPGTVDVEPPPISLTLDDLEDVDLDGTPTNAAILQYDQQAGQWVEGELVLDDLNQILDVQVDYANIENGDGIRWDGRLNRWVLGRPGEEGPLQFVTATYTTAESPLLGGNLPLSNDAAWTNLGFELFDPNDDEFFGDRYREWTFAWDPGDPLPAAQGVQLLNGPAESEPLDTELPVVNFFTKIVVSTLGFTWGTAGVYDDFMLPDSPSSNWNYIQDRTPLSSLEITVLQQDAGRFSMQMLQAGIKLNHVEPDGTEWTIIRREMRALSASFRTYCTEVWISSTGNYFVKQGDPSWGFDWQTPRTDVAHGISWTLDPQAETPPAGFGDGSWANIPTRGGYVAFAGKEALPEVKPVYALDDLTDVNATTPVNGDIIQWNGSEWVNTQLPDAGAQDLDDLNDVDTTGASANDILTYNGSTWEAAEAPDTDLANASINDLSDVRTTDNGGPQVGQQLTWDGATWIPGPMSLVQNISDLGDVDTESSTPQVGQGLRWDGSNWVPSSATGGGAANLGELGDVNVSSPAPTDGQVLSYNQSEDEWEAGNPRATSGAPTGTTFPGKPGEMRYDNDYFYICIAPNTWKQVALSAIGDGPDPGPDPIGDVADGGNFLDGTPGTIDTIIDGGNWTTGVSNDEQDVNLDGGYFTPDAPELPGPDDAVDGGNWTDGTPGNDFQIDGGNFTTGAAGTADITLDGGLFTSDSTNPGPDDAIDGGDFTDGTPGNDFQVDGGNFTSGAAGTDDITLDGGLFASGSTGPGPDDSIDGGNWTDGTPGNNFTAGGGNFTTGAPGYGNDVLDGGVFTADIDFSDGGNFTDGTGGGVREIIDGGNFTLGWVIDDSPADGGDFSIPQNGSANEILDAGDFSP